jgi:hypothetical protein
MALVGLDVHQAPTVAAVLEPSTGELRVERLRGEPASVVPVFLEELDRPVAAVYEAGPTGFALVRVAQERGLDVRVVAPASIPRAPGDRVKTTGVTPSGWCACSLRASLASRSCRARPMSASVIWCAASRMRART